MPGEQQTVYRADLYAALRAMEEAKTSVTIVSDCYGVAQQAQGVIRGVVPGVRKSHADLWKSMDAIVNQRRERGWDTQIRWVPAHLPEAEVEQPGKTLGETGMATIGQMIMPKRQSNCTRTGSSDRCS